MEYNDFNEAQFMLSRLCWMKLKGICTVDGPKLPESQTNIMSTVWSYEHDWTYFVYLFVGTAVTLSKKCPLYEQIENI